MKYCSECGADVGIRVPEGDNRPRHLCDACGTIHYQNPKIVVGCIPEWEGQILLCRRAIEPRHGLWTLPAGFMENGETTQQGAARETWEEAKAQVEVLDLYSLFSLPHINQVYMLFRARLQARDFAPGAESLEVALFDLDAIPWSSLAFPVIKESLECYVRDRAAGRFHLHSGAIDRTGLPPGQYAVSYYAGQS